MVLTKNEKSGIIHTAGKQSLENNFLTTFTEIYIVFCPKSRLLLTKLQYFTMKGFFLEKLSIVHYLVKWRKSDYFFSFLDIVFPSHSTDNYILS